MDLQCIITKSVCPKKKREKRIQILKCGAISAAVDAANFGDHSASFCDFEKCSEALDWNAGYVQNNG